MPSSPSSSLSSSTTNSTTTTTTTSLTTTTTKRRKKKQQQHQQQSRRRVTICTIDAKYEIITQAAKACGLRVVRTDDDKCNIYWIDASCITERFARLEPWQRINHLPGMSHISRKNRLAQNLGKMRRQFPKEFAFYPKTWVLPHDAKDFRAQFDAEGRVCASGTRSSSSSSSSSRRGSGSSGGSGTTFIIKPENSSKGRGIFLVKSLEKVVLSEPQVAQVYVSRPLTLDGFKFDIRMYALIASCDPLRIYKYQDGLVRLCTSTYTRPGPGNLDDRFMHLTNSAINRFSENYAVGGGRRGGDAGKDASGEAEEQEEDDETGSKRSLKWFLGWVQRQYGEAAAEKLWQQMGELCVKTVLSILPTLVRDYKALFGEDAGAGGTDGGPAGIQGSRAFEILGFDIMIDHALKPWLLEVNTLPSFATDSAVDMDVKRNLIEQTLRTVQAKASDCRTYQARRKTESEERLHRQRLRTDSFSHALQDEANVVVQTRRKIEDLLQQHAPDRLGMIDKLMNKNKGREASLLGRLMHHFKTKAGTTTTNPSAMSCDAAEFEEEEKASSEQPPPVPLRSESPSTSVSALSSSNDEEDDGDADAQDGGDKKEEEEEEEEEGGDDEPEEEEEEEVTTAELEQGQDEESILKDFDRIYPLAKGPVDIYAPLISYVWEREYKLLRGNRPSTGGSGGLLRSQSPYTALRRTRFLSLMSSSSAAAAAAVSAKQQHQQQQQQEQQQQRQQQGIEGAVEPKDAAMAVLNMLNKRTSSRQGQGHGQDIRTMETEDQALDALLLRLVSGTSSSGSSSTRQRRLVSSSSSSSSSSSLSRSRSSSSSSSCSPVKTRQAAAADRLMRGHSCDSKELEMNGLPPMRPVTATAAMGGGATAAPSRRHALYGGPRPGFTAVKPKLLDLAALTPMIGYR